MRIVHADIVPSSPAKVKTGSAAEQSRVAELAEF